MSNSWIVRYPVAGALQMRLFCLPSAGSGAAQFNRWARQLPPGLELNAVQLPGRESRLREPLFRQLAPLVTELVAQLRPSLAVPFAFLGHSLGALIAFEATHELRRAGGPLPSRLLVIGRRAPQLPLESPPLHLAGDDELLDWMRRLGGTPERLLEMPEMVQLFLPIVRADLAINETYTYAPLPALPLPISAFGGVRDSQTNRSQLAGWGEQTTVDFRIRLYPGGHFFFKDNVATLLRDVAQDLSRDVASASSSGMT